MERVYADANATYGLLEEVKEFLRESANSSYLNGSSIHAEGQSVRAKLDDARRAIYEWSGLGDGEFQVVFTSGATESINTALFYPFHTEDGASYSGNIVSTSVEHSAGKDALERLEKWGVEVRLVKPDNSGEITVEKVLELVDQDTKLVSLIWANNESGIIHPIPEIFSVLKDSYPELLLHTDGVQMVSKMPVALSEFAFDYLTIAPHKFGALPGIGGSIINKRLSPNPLSLGGAQELRWRPGTENTLGILSAGIAFRELPKLVERFSNSVGPLRDQFEVKLLESFPTLEIIGDKAERLPNTSFVRFPELTTDDLLVALDMEGVSCSRGSACSSGKQLGSHVLHGMGYPEEAGKEVIRFSFRADFTEKELNTLLERLFTCLNRFKVTTSP